ncbi:MAG: hypothetical protein M1817_002276 [Caeruleum heppii]|nr:MAG: hypothetical protein M1817_002276 [Caeruleum heppii]
MCGRYALALRPGEVRRMLLDYDMPVDEAPEDDAVRQSYNVAPGYNELVYRADVPDWGAGPRRHREGHEEGAEEQGESGHDEAQEGEKSTRYKLQAMKWGLIPFWTKRNPDYGSMMRTINCRDDSLMQSGGMWNTMKQKKRCIVVCQGFYEWLKKNGGKEKIPHFVKRKDEKLMMFAGLWDCAQYEDSDDKIYTYTIITTDSNTQLKFLHDRMPVVLEDGSDDLRTWLDPGRSSWSKELQSLLRPYKGDLDIYPVSKDVGKVGNNSPSFIIPISSSDNKQNIANFFGNAKAAAKKGAGKETVKKEEKEILSQGKVIKHEPDEKRETVDQDGTEDNAPLPQPAEKKFEAGSKRSHAKIEDDEKEEAPPAKSQKSSSSPAKPKTSPSKPSVPTPTRKTRSATSNGTADKVSPTKRSPESKKITNFFGK